MDWVQRFQQSIETIEDRIGYRFVQKKMLIISFVHRSFINEQKGQVLEQNERLEFLGDSVLGLIVADLLYERLPSCPEGTLSQLRSKLVDASSCALYLQKLSLSEYIFLGRGETLTQGRAKLSIQADVFEAIIGAIYLDGGWESAHLFFTRHFLVDVEKVLRDPPRNYKAELQDYSQKNFQKAPLYQIVQETGPDHNKTFTVCVCVNDLEKGVGVGSSKKEAEQKAAQEALSRLQEEEA